MNKIFVSLFLITVSYCVSGQNIHDNSLLKDGSFRHGVLDNGFSYYILKSQSSSQINIRFVVNAGNLDETTNQIGMAHLIEHLSFRSTKNFPNGLRKFFKELPTAVDLGASTGEIIDYHITMPSGDSALLQKGFLAVKDWSHGLSFLRDDVIEERMIVGNEILDARSEFTARTFDLNYKILDSNPVYKKSHERELVNVRTGSDQLFLQFYEDWFQPRYQAVIIMGDLDPVTIEKKIHRTFSDIINSNPPQSRNRAKYDIPLIGRERLIITDSLPGHRNSISVYKKRKDKTSENTYRITVIDRLVNEMIQARKRSTNSSIQTYVSRRHFHVAAGIDAIVSTLSFDNNREIKSSLIKVFEDLERIRQYGFSDAEVKSAKFFLLKDIDRELTDFELTNAIVDGFVSQDLTQFLLDRKKKVEMLNKISVAEINKTMAEWLSIKGNLDVVISTGKTNDKTLPNETMVLTWLRETQKKKIEPYTSPVVKGLPATTDGVDPTTCIVEKLQGLDVTKVVLPNGVNILLKNIPPKNGYNDVQLRAICTNNSIGSEEYDKYSVLLENISSFTGIGNLSVKDLENWSDNGGNAGVTVNIRVGETELNGSGDATQLLKLVNLYMTQGSHDAVAFQKYCKKAMLSNSKRRAPSEILADTISNVLLGMTKSNSKVTCENIEPKKLLELYHEQFKDPTSFTFILIGPFEEDKMIDLVAKYLGALPTVKESKLNKGILSGSGLKGARQIVIKSVDTLSNAVVKMVWPIEYESNLRNKLLLELMGKGLQSTLFTRLREKEMGVYFARTDVRSLDKSGRLFLTLHFSCMPKDIDRLVSAAKDEINKLMSGELDKRVFDNALGELKSQTREDMNGFLFWLKLIEHEIRNRTYMNAEVDHLNVLDTISSLDVINAAKAGLDLDRYVIVKIL